MAAAAVLRLMVKFVLVVVAPLLMARTQWEIVGDRRRSWEIGRRSHLMEKTPPVIVGATPPTEQFDVVFSMRTPESVAAVPSPSR